MDNCGNSRANTCIQARLRRRVVVFIRYRTYPGSSKLSEISYNFELCKILYCNKWDFELRLIHDQHLTVHWHLKIRINIANHVCWLEVPFCTRICIWYVCSLYLHKKSYSSLYLHAYIHACIHVSTICLVTPPKKTLFLHFCCFLFFPQYFSGIFFLVIFGYLWST